MLKVKKTKWKREVRIQQLLSSTICFFKKHFYFEIIKIILFSNFRLEEKLQKIIQSSCIPFSQIPHNVNILHNHSVLISYQEILS